MWSADSKQKFHPKTSFCAGGGCAIFIQFIFPPKVSSKRKKGSFDKPTKKSMPNYQNVSHESPKKKKLIKNSKNIVLQSDLVDTRDIVLTTIPKIFHNGPDTFFCLKFGIWSPIVKRNFLPKHCFEHVKRFFDISNKIYFAKSPNRLALRPKNHANTSHFKNKFSWYWSTG